MSSVLDLLRLPVLDPISRIRVGATVALGAALPAAGGDATTSAAWLRQWSGHRATEQLWLPLLRAKLGEQAELASARFIRSTFRRLFVARLRGGDGDQFGSVDGGYATVLQRLAERLADLGVDVRTASAVTGLRRTSEGEWLVATPAGEVTTDDVVLTTPGPVAAKLLGDLAPGAYIERLRRVPYLGCVCVSLVLDRPLTGGYLTYVTDDTPYTAVVEMTNLIDADSQFGGRALVYLPRYCAPDDRAFEADPDDIIETCLADLILRYPALRREHVLGAQVARARHVMPVPEPGRGQDAPGVPTGVPGIFLASSAQVVDGTLNVETTLALAEAALSEMLRPGSSENTNLSLPAGLPVGGVGAIDLTAARLNAPQPTVSAASCSAVIAPADSTSAGSTRSIVAASDAVVRIRKRRGSGIQLQKPGLRTVRGTYGVRARNGKLTASISLDADNLWSYLKTHGDPAWQARPTYLATLGPQLVDTWGRHGITGTVFVVGHDVDLEDGAAFVASLSASGHEIGNHSFEHEPWLHLYSRDRVEEELARTEAAVTSAGAPRPVGFRGPGYSLSPTLLDLLESRGYVYDATTLPTWIGPLARAYYFRSANLSVTEREKRSALFGSAVEGLRPVGPYRWLTASTDRSSATGDNSSAGLIELPVTTMPFAKVPIHISYVLHAHQVNPALARAYITAALRLCRLSGIGPSILMHPLDLLDAQDAPGLEFFPGMALPRPEKQRVVDQVLTRLTSEFDLVGTGEHARRLATKPLRRVDASTAGPRKRIAATTNPGELG
jgi:hypothetical protein